MEKWCKGCNKTKPLSEFQRHLGSRGRQYSGSAGYVYRCRACRSAYNRNNYLRHRDYMIAKARQWRNNHPFYSALNASLKKVVRQYEDYRPIFEKKLKEQNGKCAICKEEKKLGIDHNHRNGQIRGFLCTACNFLVGRAKDNHELLSNALEYLKFWNGHSMTDLMKRK